MLFILFSKQKDRTDSLPQTPKEELYIADCKLYIENCSYKKNEKTPLLNKFRNGVLCNNNGLTFLRMLALDRLFVVTYFRKLSYLL